MRKCHRFFSAFFASVLAASPGVEVWAFPITGTGATGMFTPSSSVIFNTTAGTVNMGGTVLQGTIGSDGTVFDFSNSVTFRPGDSITATGGRPLIILSTGNIAIGSSIDISGSPGNPGTNGPVGAGAGGGGGEAAVVQSCSRRSEQWNFSPQGRSARMVAMQGPADK